MRKAFSQSWGRMSIQYKIGLLCAAFILPMLILIGVLFSEFYFFHTETDRILSEYSDSIGYADAIMAETVQMQKLLYASVDEQPTALFTAQQHSDDLLQSLLGGTRADSPAVVSLKQTITRSMQYFRKQQTAFLDTLAQGAFDAQRYADLQAQGEYLHSYAERLTALLLQEGQAAYRKLGQQLTGRNMLMAALTALCALGLAGGAAMLIRSIILPVRRLSEAAMQVQQGKYDQPDLCYGQTDEIGRMADSFNQMKHQIAATIHALEAEAQLQHDLRVHEAEKARLNQLVEKSRFAQLQSQINPHFLFNTLQSIANMTELEQATVSGDMVLRLSKFFRYTLETDETIVSLLREFDLLRDYISLQELRFGERLSFEMDMEPNSGAISVPKFILQPLVENAIAHGMRQRLEGGRIRIRSRLTDAGCRITVTDNGCGFVVSDAKRRDADGVRQSIGLQNIAARVAAMHGKLRIYSVPNRGTCAQIDIKLQKAGDAE